MSGRVDSYLHFARTTYDPYELGRLIWTYKTSDKDPVYDQVICGDVDRVTHHRPFQHVLVVNPDDEAFRPDLSCCERDRTSDQTQPDDRDLVKERRRSVHRPRLDHRQPATILGHAFLAARRERPAAFDPRPSTHSGRDSCSPPAARHRLHTNTPSDGWSDDAYFAHEPFEHVGE